MGQIVWRFLDFRFADIEPTYSTSNSKQLLGTILGAETASFIEFQEGNHLSPECYCLWSIGRTLQSDNFSKT